MSFTNLIKKHLLLMAMLCIVGVVSSCQNDDTVLPTARTEYDSLDLSSPTAVVHTFVDAFKNDNYYALFLIFSPSTQSVINNNISTIDYGQLIDLSDEVTRSTILEQMPQNQAVEEWEHGTSLYLFDSIMLTAKEYSAFLIDLNGDVTIDQIVMLTDSTAEVHTTISSLEESLLFRLSQAPSGRWRVDQLILSGADDTDIPWAIARD